MFLELASATNRITKQRPCLHPELKLVARFTENKIWSNIGKKIHFINFYGTLMRSENVVGQASILVCVKRSNNSRLFFPVAVTSTELLKAMAVSMIYGKKMF